MPDPDTQLPPSASGPLEIPRRITAIGLVVVLALSAGLLAKQIACAKIASVDAATHYLPRARALARGDWDRGQSPIIPPVYTFAVSVVSRGCGGADDPFGLAGRLISAASVLGLVIVAYFLGRTLGSRRAGLAAAALTACNPWLIRYGIGTGPDALYGLLLGLSGLCLVHYWRRPGVVLAALAAGAAAVAALTRSEGIFLPAASLGAIGAVGLRRPRRLARAALHAGLFLAILAAIWWPRIRYVHDRTGQFALDARMAGLMPGGRVSLEPEWCIYPDQVFTETDRENWRAMLRGDGTQPRTLWNRIEEAGSTMVEVFGPPTVVLILLGAVVGLRCYPPAAGKHRLLLLLVALELLMVSQIGVKRRYTVTVTMFVQVWGALGAVGVSEFLRTRAGRWRRFGRSLRIQFAALGGLVVILACWTLVRPNHAISRGELRPLGRQVLRTAGPGATVLALTAQTAYYAEAKLVLVETHFGGREVSREQLARACRELDVDFIVSQTQKPWCRWLERAIGQGRLPDAAVVAAQRLGDATSYLVDARVLFSGPARAGSASAPATRPSSPDAARARPAGGCGRRSLGDRNSCGASKMSGPIRVAICRKEGCRDVPLPRYMSDHAAGMDVCAACEARVTVDPGRIVLIPCGFTMALPVGYEAQIRPRSGLALKHGIVVPNAPGTIDADYRGEVCVILGNISQEPFTVRRGMRIAQMVIAPVTRAEVCEVSELDATRRGEGGFGHTGV